MKKSIAAYISLVPLVALISACGGGDKSHPAPSAKYTLGGTVSGLSATGLILSNGQDIITIPPNVSSFSFPGQLQAGENYEVKVVGQPAGFTEVCTLRDAAGKMGAANISNIAVSCHAAVLGITTFAGPPIHGTPGDQDGIGFQARFTSPTGLGLDSLGNLYVASGNAVRKISPASVVTTFASGVKRNNDVSSPRNESEFSPFGLVVDALDNVYVSDGSRIRKITPAGVMSTLAGNLKDGRNDGTGESASFYNPEGLAVDATGNVYVADTANHLIRKITPAGVVTTLAGSGSVGKEDGVGVAASFRNPSGLVVDAEGNLLVADRFNNAIRKITPSGVVSTLAGINGGPQSRAGATPNFVEPMSLTIDNAGNIYVLDNGVGYIQKIATNGMVTALFSNTTILLTDPVTGAPDWFEKPRHLVANRYGDLFVADTLKHRIQQVGAQ
ncbi:hypothetical protein FNU76_21040 [Chitinimonas arctica]|uniref:SMP-30/Gluconolactonase/LRE-like region domain-containing protein n=1 Tax=Chitinimonas arctica TaxID=2594795 RepID=A0A516SKT8_9NEIS|nr:hypothetical protein [Chitinimonas arctica]QDQ28638.1 hypothetical protein FNU76_21040 [Chitinimonas arctica]